MNLKIEKHFNTSISWHVILAYVIYNNEIIVKISVYTFDMHVLVNKVYKKNTQSYGKYLFEYSKYFDLCVSLKKNCKRNLFI